MEILTQRGRYAAAAIVAVALFFLFDLPLTVGLKAKLSYLLPISDSLRDSLISTWCERAFVGSSGNSYSSCYFAYRDKDYDRLKTICNLMKVDMQNHPKSWVDGGDRTFLYLGNNPLFQSASSNSIINFAVCDGIE
jgi:hypothetical protein